MEKIALSEEITIAERNKPAMGEGCNGCGWCCLTEVCEVGVLKSGSSVIPCSLLRKDGGLYRCSLADTAKGKSDIGAGVGCCAITQSERIKAMNL